MKVIIWALLYQFSQMRLFKRPCPSNALNNRFAEGLSDYCNATLLQIENVTPILETIMSFLSLILNLILK